MRSRRQLVKGGFGDAEVVEVGCPWNVGTCISAARKGHLEVLKWRDRMGVIGMRMYMFSCSQGRSHLEVLKWARMGIPCIIYENACSFAASGGQLEVLK